MIMLTDHELLRIDPSVFQPGFASATTLLELDEVETSGTTVTAGTGAFDVPPIEAGRVVLLSKDSTDEQLEVLERVDGATLEVSRLRPDDDADPVAPATDIGWTLEVVTYARVIEQVHTELLDRLGVDDESDIVTIDAMKHLTAVEAAARILAHASAAAPDDTAIAGHAQRSAIRARRARSRLVITLDRDGDGAADATRRLDAPVMWRG